MKDVDGGRRIYEIDVFLFFPFLFRAIAGVWEFEIFVREVYFGG